MALPSHLGCVIAAQNQHVPGYQNCSDLDERMHAFVTELQAHCRALDVLHQLAVLSRCHLWFSISAPGVALPLVSAVLSFPRNFSSPPNNS